MSIRDKLVKWEPTINAGHILTAATLVAAVFLAYGDLRSVDVTHAAQIASIERQIDYNARTQTEILSTLTTIREDIATLKERTSNQ